MNILLTCEMQRTCNAACRLVIFLPSPFNYRNELTSIVFLVKVIKPSFEFNLELICQREIFKKLKLHGPLRRVQFQLFETPDSTRQTVRLLMEKKMTKISWRKCRMIFLEASFSHSRKIFSNSVFAQNFRHHFR